MRLKAFFKPSLMKIGTWILFAGISNFLYAYVKTINIVPCRLFSVGERGWAFCAIDPTLREGTLYFGLGFLDALYLNFFWPVVIFIGLFILLIPYSAACGIVEGYRYLMRQ